MSMMPCLLLVILSLSGNGMDVVDGYQYIFALFSRQKCWKGWCLPPEKTAFVNPQLFYIFLSIEEIGEEGRSLNQ